MPTLRELRYPCAVTVLLVLGSILCMSQSASDLASKYKPLAAYQIRPGIVVYAKFAYTGQICEATIESQLATAMAGTERSLSKQRVAEILDELVPIKERGPKTSPFLDPDSYVAGGSYNFKQDYANVSVEQIGHDGGNGLDMLKIIWIKRKCGH